MPHYEVKVQVNFYGIVHAETEQAAEDFAYSNWSEHGGAQIQYDSVEMTSATEVDADEELDNCPADCEDVEKFNEENEEDEEEGE